MNTNELDLTHLYALELRLSHERERLNLAKTKREIEMRTVWVRGIEREIEQEKKFRCAGRQDCEMSDEELLKECAYHA